MLLIQLNKQSKKPAFIQIYEQIKSLIEKGVLKPGDKLPSSRMLAQNLELNRSTVYKAYEELWSFGYIHSRPGAYSIVRERAKIANNLAIKKEERVKWEKHANLDVIKQLKKRSRHIKTLEKKDIINFLPLSPDPSLMPYEIFRKHLNKAITNGNSSLLSYNDTIGYSPLREFICTHVGQHQIQCSPENVIITNGTQNSLDLLLKFLIKPGDKIVVESPTYSAAIPLFELYGAKIIEVPVNSDGLDLEKLEEIASGNKIAMIFTMANFQNPTGISTSQAHREGLYNICKKFNIPIIEDGFEEEMKYFGKAVLPIKSIDERGLVIYLGTFSKTLFPGLRIGWIIADSHLICELVKLKQITEISGNFLIQAAVYEFCQSGNYELHIKRLHRIYRKRMSVALKSAEAYLPKDKCSYTKPNGGYSFWLRINQNNRSEIEFIELFYKKGVAIAPGNLFFVEAKNETAFRLSIAHLAEDEIEEGIKRIGMVIKEMNKKD